MWVILLLVAVVGATSPKLCPSVAKPAKDPDCGDNASFLLCPRNCPKSDSCSNIWSKFACTDDGCCRPACKCNEGYLRDGSGKCVPTKECTHPIKCGPNEERKDCKTCPPRNCDIAYTEYACNKTIPCEPGCDCIKDYLRDSNGVCVPKNKCPPPPAKNPDCGDNASFLLCPPNCPKSDNCSELWSKFPCTDDGCCYPACRCNDGYLRDESGKCVTVQECMNPIRCGPNEERTDCKTCPPRNCDIAYTEYACNKTIPCEPGCDCKKDYLRDFNGVCVPNDECPPPPSIEPPVEEVTTPTTETKVVSSTSYSKSSSKSSSSYSSSYASESSSSYSTNYEKKPKPQKCGVNEKWVPCRTIYPPQSCAISYTSYVYKPAPPCEPGCDCIDNYLRDYNGVCVLNDNCPTPPQVTEPPVPEPPQICPPATSCRANETEASCKVECADSYCPVNDDRGILICDPPHPCPSGCVCKLGYRRKSRKNPTCILAEECPKLKCTRKNEEWNTCPSCLAEDCGDINNQPSVCNELVHNCYPRCVCKKGFFRNGTDDCVPASKCPPGVETTTLPPEVKPCSENQTYVNCNYGCPTNNCPTSDTRAIVACSPPYPCPPGCACKLGYRRKSSKDQSCILAEDCTPVECTRPHEKWNPCPSPCLAERCGDQNKPPVICNTLIKDCRPKCVCEDGYYRNEDDICVPEYQCPKKECPANQTYMTCNVRCPTEDCPTNDNRFMFACAIAYPCPGGCGCKPGYRRESSDVDNCIRAEDCSPVECTRQNEEWNRCPPPSRSEYCKDADKPREPYSSPPTECDPKCVCKKGFFRNGTDVCVPLKECSPTCTDPNEELSTCPSPCLAEFCVDSKNPPIPCNAKSNDCQPARCVCKPGFFRDDSGTCVPFSECGKGLCDENEIYAFCKSGCPYDFCQEEEIRGIIACDPPYPCPKGCICKSGYKRRSYQNETCVRAEECPPVKCKGPNQKWDPCTSTCLAETCQDYLNPPGVCNEFVKSCIPKCVCEKGFYINDKGVCVPAEQCAPAKCTGQNEKFNPCTSTCLAESCKDYLNPPGVCNEFVKSCIPKCVCENGFYRNDKGVCVSAKQCGTKPCGKNENLADCGFACPQEFCRANDDLVITLCKPPRDCAPGCKCAQNYKWKSYENRTCVLAKECPRFECTRPNEEWKTCMTSCQAQTCEDYLKPSSGSACCDEECDAKCACIKGYYRNQSGDCIPAKQCGVKQCAANEILADCGFGCSQDFCPKNDNSIKIACKPPRDCAPGCKCKLNYKWKSSNNKTCILAQDCPKIDCTRPNEKWSKCPSPCLRESCDDVKNQPKTCNYLVQNCQPRCICEKGFFRDKRGNCIHASKCPNTKIKSTPVSVTPAKD